ncbi:zinc ribbon domain-containing protein [Aliiroseovarius sp. S1339]|uniref:zinc ribbon domain-containing protein n=1 Tax=Aliiroseovarius sp. S1339 TaxID=2936990 RepID=UPI0024A75E2C|nr:zinc ribbon domain-containing protein [Aliiroseovarius sp. S1339]
MLKCGCCGGSYTLMNKSKYGCASARNKGTCDNRLLIKRKEVEDRVLKGLKQKLMHPALMAEFVSEYHREWNRLQVENTSSHTRLEAELRTVLSKIAKIVDAISEGMFHASMKTKLGNCILDKPKANSYI